MTSFEGQSAGAGNKRVSAWALVPVALEAPAGEGKTSGEGGSGEGANSGAGKSSGGGLSSDPVSPPAGAVTGIVLAIGTLWDGHIKEIVSILGSIGTRDAVAMDGSTSAMLGEHGEAWFTPEGKAGKVKNVWQKYGFCCGGK